MSRFRITCLRSGGSVRTAADHSQYRLSILIPYWVASLSTKPGHILYQFVYIHSLDQRVLLTSKIQQFMRDLPASFNLQGDFIKSESFSSSVLGVVRFLPMKLIPRPFDLLGNYGKRIVNLVRNPG